MGDGKAAVVMCSRGVCIVGLAARAGWAIYRVLAEGIAI